VQHIRRTYVNAWYTVTFHYSLLAPCYLLRPNGQCSSQTWLYDGAHDDDVDNNDDSRMLALRSRHHSILSLAMIITRDAVSSQQVP